jgi:hypothetical protein
MTEVYLNVRSDAKRIPGQIIHYATVRGLDGELKVSATLDYILGVANERGYVFVGAMPGAIV